MRATMLAITVMAVVLAHAQSEPPKSMPADVGPGRVAWFDITTTDLAKSKEFYGKLFDWKFTPFRGRTWQLRLLRVDRPSGRFGLRKARSVHLTAWSMFRCRTFRRAARRRRSWGEHSYLDSPSTFQMALEPLGLSVIRPDIPWGCTRGRRSRRRSPRPSNQFVVDHVVPSLWRRLGRQNVQVVGRRQSGSKRRRGLEMSHRLREDPGTVQAITDAKQVSSVAAGP